MLKARQNAKRGFVLLSVLLMIVLLSVVLLDFNRESTLNVRLAGNHLHSQQALLCAEAGLNTARAAIAIADDTESDAMKALLVGMTLRIGDGTAFVRIIPESGKINVHKLIDDTGKIDRLRVDQMLRLIDVVNSRLDGAPVKYEIVPAIIDWIDDDDDVAKLPFIQRQNEGAENSYYRRQPRPYYCKNGLFDTVSEVLLVKGMTRDIFEGGTGISGMKDLITIYGDGRINLRYASADVIQSLSENITREGAELFVEHRDAEEPASAAGFAGLSPEEAAAISRVATTRYTERFFSVTVTGEAAGLQRTIKAVVEKTGGDARVVYREE